MKAKRYGRADHWADAPLTCEKSGLPSISGNDPAVAGIGDAIETGAAAIAGDSTAGGDPVVVDDAGAGVEHAPALITWISTRRFNSSGSLYAACATPGGRSTNLREATISP